MKTNARSISALTLLEMLLSLAIMAVVFAAILPQFRNIQNSWAAKQGVSEALQNGRILIDHMNRNLASAERITAVSDPDVSNGFISYEATDGLTYRYEISNDRYVQFGTVGNLSELAGPVQKLQFTCYDAYDLDNVTTDLTAIRCVKVNATMDNSSPLGQDKTLSTAAYLRVNSTKNLPSLYKEEASSFEFNVTNGGWPALGKVDDTHYLCSYAGPNDDGFAVVIDVDLDAWTVDRGSVLEFDSKNGQFSNLIQLDATHFLCAYASESDKGTVMVLAVNKALKKVTSVSSLVFDDKLGMYPSLSQIDSEHYLCAYTGQSAAGQAVIISVDPDDWSMNKEFGLTFDASRGSAPALTKINTEHHLCVYEGSFGRGMAVVLTVDTVNWELSKETASIFDSVACTSPAICQIDSRHYLCTYAGTSSVGKGVILSVNGFAWSVSTLSRFLYDSDVGLFPDLKQIDSDRYICVYEGKNNDAWANVLNVNTTTWEVAPGIAVEYDLAGGESPAMAQIDENHFLCVYQGSNNDGWAAILNTDSPVLP